MKFNHFSTVFSMKTSKNTGHILGNKLRQIIPR